MSQGIRAGQTVSSIPFGYDRHGRPLRVWRRRKDVTLRSCFAYPVVDGPGVALLVVMPPFLAIMALPVFDMMVHFRPGNALNPVALLILPFTLPLVATVGLTVGYILLFQGRILISSATGEDDHPRWPAWDRMEILDELGRWIWAGLMGLVVGGFPALCYWINCGDVDWLDSFLFLDLAILGAAYAQMALMASLLHETLVAANPITVLRSMSRLGWDYLGPCVVTGLAIVLDLAAWSFVLLHSPNVMLGVLGLWACWVFTLYMATVISRVLGTTYYKHAATLGWFRTAARG
jgi:hypothetical protein